LKNYPHITRDGQISMNDKTEVVSTTAEVAKWLLVAVLVLVSVFGNYYFEEQPVLYRFTGVLLVAIAAAFIFTRTLQGQSFLNLLKESRVEIKKVVWPTKQETMQTTVFVVLIVLFMSAVLWGFDTLLGFAISSLLG